VQPAVHSANQPPCASNLRTEASPPAPGDSSARADAQWYCGRLCSKEATFCETIAAPISLRRSSPRVGEPAAFVGLTRTLRAVHGGNFVPRFSRTRKGCWSLVPPAELSTPPRRIQRENRNVVTHPVLEAGGLRKWSHSAECGSHETRNYKLCWRPSRIRE